MDDVFWRLDLKAADLANCRVNDSFLEKDFLTLDFPLH